jgi:hypothetical protein
MKNRIMKYLIVLGGMMLFFGIGTGFSQNILRSSGAEAGIDTVITPLQKVKYKIYNDKIYLGNRKKFNPYTLSIFWRQDYTRKYKPQSLDLIFKQPKYKPIVFKPQSIPQKMLKDYEDLMNARQLSSKLSEKFKEGYSIQKAIERAAIHDPQYVEFNWDDIPEPHKFVDRGYLATKRSEDDLLDLLQTKSNYDTKRQIQKLQKIKTPWLYEGAENIQLSQVYLANWVKGGESSISVLSDLRLKAIYKVDKYTWENYGIHKIGFVGQQESKTRINDDLLELNSKFGLNASEKWYYSAFTNFKTQFFNGYEGGDKEKENPISGFFSPAYMTFAVGMDFKATKHDFSLMISPLTAKLTMVLDTNKVDQTRYGVSAGRKVESLNGGSIVNSFRWKINEDFVLNSNLSAFYQYFARNGEEKEVQFEWETILNMRINVWLSTRILAHMRYYSNESDKLQFKENLSLSFVYIVRYKR